jgi:hypothetical protein
MEIEESFSCKRDLQLAELPPYNSDVERKQDWGSIWDFWVRPKVEKVDLDRIVFFGK